MGPTAELRGSRYYVAWGVVPRAPLFFLSAPKDEAALRAKLAAYEKLLEQSNDENHYEVFWLRDLIKDTRDELGISERSQRGPQ